MTASPHKENGSAILEALIAITLFSIGVLALVGLQSAMVKQGSQAQFRAEAISLADEINGLMWSDAAHLSSFRIADCSEKSTNKQAEKWRSEVLRRVPKGCGNVSVTGSDVTISISWQVGSEARNSHTFSTSILR
jgi:type IV pilus assembly protein PilV